MLKLTIIIILAILSLSLFNSNVIAHKEINIFLGDYQITMSQNLIIFLIILFIFLISFLIYLFISLKFYKKHKEISSYNKKSRLALDHMVDCITLTSLGDFSASAKHLKQLNKNLPDHPLVNLLNLQNNSLANNKKAMDKDFRILLNNKKTKNFALQGLAMIATQNQDFAKAKLYLEESYHDNPYGKNTVIALLKTYQKQQDWQKLKDLIKENYQKKILNKKDYDHILAISYLMLYQNSNDGKDLLKARKLYANHHIIELEYARYLLQNNKKSSLTRYIKKILLHNNNPELINIFLQNITDKNASTQLKKLEKLSKINPKNITIIIKFIEISMSQKIRLSDSKKLLQENLHISNSHALYEVAIKFFENNNDSVENHDLLQSLLKQEKYYDQKNYYLCNKCNHKSDIWQVVCPECNSFDSLGRR